MIEQRVPLRVDLQEMLEHYVELAGIEPDPNTPLFRTAKGKTKTFTEKSIRAVSLNWAMYCSRKMARTPGMSQLTHSTKNSACFQASLS